MGWFPWLFLFLFFLNPCPLHSLQPRKLCSPHESSALISFKNSFLISNDNSRPCSNSSNNRTVSWDMDRDCCSWRGVTCDELTGQVNGLHLGCSDLRGFIDSNNSFFSLTHLRTLNLSNNDLEGSISSKFGTFPSLINLDLSLCYFSGNVPLELGHLSKLLTLDLSSNFELRPDTASLRRITANLTSLTTLSLYGLDLSDVSFSSFINLSLSLTTLNLRQSGLNGELPESIFRLPNLEVLYLSGNPKLTFPQHSIWTGPLKILDLSLTGLRGQIPWISLNLGKLTHLDLSTNDLLGQLPEICSNTSEKTFLCDSSTHQLVGPLPLNLESLFLDSNFLNGTIPSWLYSLPSLQILNLGYNEFTGHIAKFKYHSLRSLDLNSNKLNGHIPRSMFQQAYLSYLDLSSNNLSGVVMLEQFSKLRNLEYLSLSFNRLSVISIHHANYTLPLTIQSLGLSSCNISEFPYSSRNLEQLGFLDLSNNRIEGSVPKWLGNVGKDSLSYLNISRNFLTHMGSIPWKNLQYIDFRSNQLQGNLPIPPPSSIFFSVSNNKIVGEISYSICNLGSIQFLDLSNNSLSGKIPACNGNFGNSLNVLDLHMNKFGGIFPLAFAEGSSLRTLNLNGNEFEGPLPKTLINCQNLEVLDVGNNKMNGSFPFWLESLSELQVLILRSNEFSGTVNSHKETILLAFQKLRIMDLSNNQFMGFLPTKYFENLEAMRNAHTDKLEYMEKYVGQGSYYQDSMMVVIKGNDIKLEKIQKMLMMLDFSNNSFTGDIPKVIGNLNSLKGLNFSHNKLTGAIPSSLAGLSNLESLDLSSNELSGQIPRQLASDLFQLQNLNLSNNKLEGPIPRGPQFITFNKDSFKGNPQLCGLPLDKLCTEYPAPELESSDDFADEYHKLFNPKAVVMGFGSGLVIGISIGYMILFGTRFDYWLKERLGRPRPRRQRRRTN